jgi:hypothetical protein
VHPPHDDIKDALSFTVDMAIAPVRHATRDKPTNIIYHSRFGGVAA